MKKIIKVATVVLTIILTMALVGCVSPYTYDNASAYIKGGTMLSNTQTVNEIEIDWVSGSVEVKYGDVENVTISETANNLTDANQLRYKVENGSLSIKFCKSGANSSNVGSKALLVILPTDLRLNELSIDMIDGEISVNSVRAISIEVESVSGDVTLTDCTANEVDVESVSGDVLISGEISDLGVESTSGEIECVVSLAQVIDINSTSGSVELTPVGSMPLSLEVESVSGDVRLTLIPADFSIKYQTTSGDFYCEYPTTTDGNVYSYGEGANLFEIKTISGDLKVYEIE